MPVHPARPTPFLRRTPSGRQLIVDGDAVLLLGGQLHNSSPSSPTHMRPVWEGLAATGIRSVIGNVSWAQVEPEEGSFDFRTVDAQVAEARDRNMRLVLSPGGPTPADTRPFGLVVAESADRFLLVGQGVGLDFSSEDGIVEVDCVEEGRMSSGRWHGEGH